MSQVFTTADKSHEITRPALTWRVTDIIRAKVSGFDVILVMAGIVGEVPICQNLTDSSADPEMREEENIRQMIS